ncbi:hypothetical protein Bca4012_026267 [Brassica carinata]|uniref:Uncharacterized protein n=1 Tax=Brassica carinata TaxID=52824 RepID=A0A8X8AUA7_BRACI|nr:hypothetical protein Bca52824_023354 [Brassica carinata]
MVIPTSPCSQLTVSPLFPELLFRDITTSSAASGSLHSRRQLPFSSYPPPSCPRIHSSSLCIVPSWSSSPESGRAVVDRIGALL